MKVSIICGQYAYAVCEWPSGARMDIRLEPGQSAEHGLEAYAQEQERKARDAMRCAEIARRAALTLKCPKAPKPKFVSAEAPYGGAYAYKCECGDIMALGDTAQEAQEKWQESWIAENA